MKSCLINSFLSSFKRNNKTRLHKYSPRRGLISITFGPLISSVRNSVAQTEDVDPIVFTLGQLVSTFSWYEDSRWVGRAISKVYDIIACKIVFSLHFSGVRPFGGDMSENEASLCRRAVCFWLLFKST